MADRPEPAPSPVGVVDWRYTGRPDFFLGTGATPGERALGWGAALGLTALVYALVWHGAGLGWAPWQWALALALAADVAGGVVANALNAHKRYAHAPVQPGERGLHALVKRRPLIFPLVHGHPILVAAAFDGTFVYGAGWYIGILAACALVARLPPHLRRPAALAAVAVAILVDAHLVAPPDGFAWFGPFLALKLVYGYMVPEEPYRPASHAQRGRADAPGD